MCQETEYGWFSDIESNPDVIYVEYEHIVSKGIYRVRNVHIEFPLHPIEISLTGESFRNDPGEHTMNTTSTYNISQTQYIDVPRIIYINEQPHDTVDDNSPEKIQECYKWHTNCIQHILYIFTACAIVLFCWV